MGIDPGFRVDFSEFSPGGGSLGFPTTRFVHENDDKLLVGEVCELPLGPTDLLKLVRGTASGLTCFWVPAWSLV